jgi:hypothetical protein
MFGLKSVWRRQVKISISDSTRTMRDMLNDPRLGKESGLLGLIFGRA